MNELSPTSDMPSPGGGSKGSWSASRIDGPGTIIGPFKVLQVLGEGGFGVVYLAEQREPINRRVALKVIKLGMDSSEVLARFEAERQALALMDHPNVASFYDAGATENGRPYFAMEYVAGLPINKYCDQSRLTTRERLLLFIQVCHAVQHAHQKGIIHRDLKPGNILVAMHDGKPVPKVIDFGIAKALVQRLTDKTLFTEHGRMIGTPEYMSPEQAGTTGLDVDTRADVYSLGVVLYELLVGVLPFDPRTLREAAYDEVVRIIREQDPPRLSTRLSRLGDAQSTAAQNRREAIRELRAEMSGDLDWITMRALEKDRSRRYPTAQDLAADISRYLSHEPVVARPPSIAYRTSKFVRRHRFGVAAGLTIVAALALGIAGTGLGLRRALAAEADAKRERDKAIAVSTFIENTVLQASPTEGSARDTLLRDVVSQAAQRAAKSLGNAPEIRTAVVSRLGATLAVLGMYDEADSNLRAALDEATARLGPAHPDTLDIRFSIGMLQWKRGRADEASATLNAVLADDLARDAGSVRAARVRANIAGILRSQNKLDEAEAAVHSALGALPAPDPAKPDELADATRLLARRTLASIREGQERYAESESLYRELLAEYRAREDAYWTATTLSNIAELLRLQNRAAEGAPLAAECLEIRRRILPPDHPQIADALNRVGGLYLAEEKFQPAADAFAEAVAIAKRPGREPARNLDTIVMNLANALNDAGKPGEAEPLAREALTLAQKRFKPDSPMLGYPGQLLGRILTETDRAAEAEPLLRDCVVRWTASMKPDNWLVAQSRSALGGCLVRLGKLEEARPLLEEAYPALVKGLGESRLRTRQAAQRLSEYYLAAGDRAKADEYARLAAPK